MEEAGKVVLLPRVFRLPLPRYPCSAGHQTYNFQFFAAYYSNASEIREKDRDEIFSMTSFSSDVRKDTQKGCSLIALGEVPTGHEVDK